MSHSRQAFHWAHPGGAGSEGALSGIAALAGILVFVAAVGAALREALVLNLAGLSHPKTEAAMSHHPATQSNAVKVMAAAVLAVLLCLSACGIAPDGVAQQDASQSTSHNHNTSYNRNGP